MGELKTFSFGSCAIAKYSPQKSKISANSKTINITVGFEEALKINLALDECIRKLNKYKRTTKKGKKAAVNIIIHFNEDRIAIAEDTI